MSQLKSDYKKITDHIDYLKSPTSWLVESQKFWPRFLFHFTDITNARSILETGALYPREKIQQNGRALTDIADPGIIAGTLQKWKQFVRLYFRPRTPMQYSNEGIRPKRNLESGAHCPVPVIFLFEAKSILSRLSTQFSNGNLRKEEVQVGDDSDFFLSLPFEKIYHDRRLDDEEKREIVFRRHAEVMVPGELDLAHLHYIVCRSPAEYETLLSILPVQIRDRWKDKLAIDSKKNYFFKYWVYVEKAVLTASSATLYFNPSIYSHPFHARVEFEHLETGQNFIWKDEGFNVESGLSFDLSNFPRHGRYRITLYLDEHLAYQNTFSDESGLF